MSCGYQKTTVSPRETLPKPKRYVNLLMKMRSWSVRVGIMLVPSTFTGW